MESAKTKIVLVQEHYRDEQDISHNEKIHEDDIANKSAVITWLSKHIANMYASDDSDDIQTDPDEDKKVIGISDDTLQQFQDIFAKNEGPYLFGKDAEYEFSIVDLENL